MGALSSIRKRGDDYYKSSPPIDYHHQQFSHVSKKPKFSVSSVYSGKNTPDCSRFGVSSSVISRISAYPDLKSRFSREVHAPVRNSRFGNFFNSRKSESSGGCKESSVDRMGNCLGIYERYEKVKLSAIKSLRFVGREEESFLGKEKEKEVIEIDDDDDDDDDDDEKQYDFRDSSAIEEADVMDWKEGPSGVESPWEIKARMVEKELPSRDSSVRSDVSNANAKIDGVVVLDREQYDSGVPLYKKLYDSSRKRDGKLNNLRFDIELNEKRSQGYHSLRFQKKPEQVKDRAEECFVTLTEEEEFEVSRALHNSNRRRVLVNHVNSNIDITGEKLQCLKPGGWLNDEVINVYLELLKEREKREPEKFLKCHFFSTFFYKKLISGKDGYNFQSVRRWTTQRKLGYGLLECDKIFVPIHQQIHWCLGVINKKEQKFQYLDSLKGRDYQVMDVLARYYVDEVKDKTGKDIDVSSWEQEFVRDLPEQENGFDCGVFMIKYADFYSRDVGLRFTQDHMPYFRRRTAKEILKLRAE